MNKIALLAGMSILALFSATPVGAAEKVKNSDYSIVEKATVRIVARRKSDVVFGAGFVLIPSNPDRNAGLGTIVTADHIVRGSDRITVILPGAQEQLTANLRYQDATRDIAILEVKDLDRPALTLTTVLPNVGAPMRAAGYSSVSDREDENSVAGYAQIKAGILSRNFRGKNALDLIEHDIQLSPGYSGGPVVDECGRVVSMDLRNGGSIDLGTAGSIPLSPGVGTAIAADEIIKVLQDQNIRPFTPDTSDCVDALPREADSGRMSTAPVNSTAKGGGIGHWLAGLGIARLIAAIVLALGIAGAGGALYILAKGKDDSVKDGEDDKLQGHAPQAVGVVVGIMPDREEAIELTGTSPKGQAIRLRFTASELRTGGKFLGRDGSKVDGLIPDSDHVSRTHACLGYNGSNYTITDVSSYGTRIQRGQSDRKIEPKEDEILSDGDIIRLGNVGLSVRITR